LYLESHRCKDTTFSDTEKDLKEKSGFHKARGKEKHHHTMRSDGVYIME